MPVCIFVCLRKSTEYKNAAPQIWHKWDLIWVCFALWHCIWAETQKHEVFEYLLGTLLNFSLLIVSLLSVPNVLYFFLYSYLLWQISFHTCHTEMVFHLYAYECEFSEVPHHWNLYHNIHNCAKTEKYERFQNPSVQTIKMLIVI